MTVINFGLRTSESGDLDQTNVCSVHYVVKTSLDEDNENMEKDFASIATKYQTSQFAGKAYEDSDFIVMIAIMR